MPNLRVSLAFLLACIPAFAQCTNPKCSLVNPAAFVGFVPGAVSTYSSLRVEARLVGMNWLATTGSNMDIFNTGGYIATYLGGSGSPGQIYFSAPDNGGLNTFCFISLNGVSPADMLVRITRDIAGSQIRGEAWNTITGAALGPACVATLTSPASNASIQATGIQLGRPSAATILGGSIAFLRWFPSSVPLGTVPPVAIASPAGIADYEFDNNSNDTSGNSQNITGTFTYVNTPIYNPSCSAGTQQSLNVGTTMTLDGSNSMPLDGGLTLTYAWSYFVGSDGVNQAPSITAATSVTTTVTGLNLFGGADFQLIVTDSSANSTTCNIHNGMVQAATNGVIDLTGEGVSATAQQFVGPLIRLGQNRWPWADTIHLTEANLQVSNLATYYTPFWRTPMAGTISVVAGSATITGTGTNLLAPCNGGSAPLGNGNGPSLILIYPGTDGLTHYLAGQTISCTDATHLVFHMPGGGVGYPSGTPGGVLPNCTVACTGWHWQWGYAIAGGDPDIQPNSQYGNWIYGVAPGNYYDNAKMFFSMYYRSGIDTYQQAFHNLADWWWEFPIMDQGYACDPAGSTCWAPAAYRSMAMNGIWLRALEQGISGNPKWAGLWDVSQLAASTLLSYASLPAPVGIDARETGYMLSILSYCALADPDSSHVLTCRNSLNGSLAGVWTPNLRADIGNAWGGFLITQNVPAAQASSITALSGTGSVCVTNGSTSVVGSGTSWGSGWQGLAIWFWDGVAATAIPTTNAVGDPVTYGVAWVDATHLTLNAPYAGTTGCSKGYMSGYNQGDFDPSVSTNAFTAWGILPYSEGMLGTGFGWAAKALDSFNPTSAALFRTYLHNTVLWEITYGMQGTGGSSKGGLWSGSMFVGCVPPVALTNRACNPGDESSVRTLSLDVMRAFAMDYANSPNPTVLAAADLLMSQMFSKPGTGGPNPDGHYITEYDGSYVTGTPPVGSAPKWAGQLCGFEEACDMWPAARLLGGTGGGGRIGGGVRSKGIVSQ